MTDETFMDASIEKDNRNYDKAIKILTKLINNHNDPLKKQALTLLYKTRAECYYLLQHCKETIDDITRAAHEGFIIGDSEQYFYMLQHSKLQCDINKIIKEFQDQVKLKSNWDCYRVIKMLKNLKIENIFLKRECQRGRSQSADRSKKHSKKFFLNKNR